MSEFRFLCLECGQKILGDTAYSGAQITCPTCQKTITIPAAASDAPSPPLPAPIPQPASRFAPPSPAAATGQAPGRLSRLAVASLICSVFVPLGSIPGIICGHMAKARMKSSIFLEGGKMASAGLLVSYCVLMATLAAAGTFLVAHWHFSPMKVMRESPAAIAAMQSRIVDEVIASESEDDHDVDGQAHNLAANQGQGKIYRTTSKGGSFSYMMQVLPDQAMTLNCRYWGGEKKGHLFDIAVDNQIIATQNLTGIAPGHYVDMEYKIPASLTRGKTRVKVEFQAHTTTMAGGLYGCQMLKR